MDEEKSPQNEITIFGETNFRNLRRSFGIKRDDRRRHMYVIGKTGMGKTTLLENMIISDIINGEGCCYVDPHGDTAEKLLDFIPANRVNDVIYFNPADIEFPIAFNVLEAVDEKTKHLIASGLVSVFKKQFADSWGPRLEYILRNAILALLDYPGSTLLGIMRILVDKAYRQKVVEKIKDPVVRSFWVNEYTQWNDRTLQEVISPIQNKVGQFLSNVLIRNIVGQVKSTFDLREVMDKKKILILNLSKGRIGEDTMQLIGSMMVTKLYMAAMSRVDVPEKERQDFYLYVDEFQNFATDSFADILSEARKYRLDLIMAHQYIEQVPELVSAAIFGNVGTMMVLRVGATDAEMLVKEFTPVFTEEDLVNLPAFNMYLKLMIDGITSDPFSAATLPPLFEDYRTGNNDKVIRVSRERYANERHVVEDKINRWSGMDLSEKIMETVGGRDDKSRGGSNVFAGNSAPRPEKPRTDHAKPENDIHASGLHSTEHHHVSHEQSGPVAKKSYASQPSSPSHDQSRPSAPRSDKPVFLADCSICGQESKFSFKPDSNRPIICRDCLNKMQRGEPIEGLEEVREAEKEKPINKQNSRPIRAVTSEAPSQAPKAISLESLRNDRKKSAPTLGSAAIHEEKSYSSLKLNQTRTAENRPVNQAVNKSGGISQPAKAPWADSSNNGTIAPGKIVKID